MNDGDTTPRPPQTVPLAEPSITSTAQAHWSCHRCGSARRYLGRRSGCIPWGSVVARDVLAQCNVAEPRRQDDPVRRWKLSSMDIASLDGWDAYTEAEEATFYPDRVDAAWPVIKSNHKKQARMAELRYVPNTLEYDDKEAALIAIPDPIVVVPAASVFESGDRLNRMFSRLWRWRASLRRYRAPM